MEVWDLLGFLILALVGVGLIVYIPILIYQRYSNVLYSMLAGYGTFGFITAGFWLRRIRKRNR